MSNILNLRETFGVIDKATGQKYPDILSCFLQEAYFTYAHLYADWLLPKNGNLYYSLQMDSKLKQKLKTLRGGEEQKVIVSFQRRTTGAIALARIFAAPTPTQPTDTTDTTDGDIK